MGMMVSLAFFQEDTWLKERLEHMIKESISSVIGVPFTCSLSRVDLLGGIITASAMHAEAPDGAWSFTCPDSVIRFSWFSWLRHRNFDTQLIFQKATVFSRYENKQWAVVDPFIKLVRAPATIPIKLVNCSFKQGTVNLTRDDFVLNFSASSSSEILSDIVLTRIMTSDGKVLRSGNILADKLSGTIDVDVPIENTDNYTVKTHLDADLPFVRTLPCRSLLVYTYEHSVGSWHWYPEDRSIAIKAEGITFNPDESMALDVEVKGPVERFALYLPFIPLLKSLRGNMNGSGHVVMQPGGISYKGVGRVHDLVYEGMKCGETEITFEGDTQRAQGTVTFKDLQGIAATGTWNYDMKNETSESSFKLTKDCARIPQYIIEKEGTQAMLTYTQGKLTGCYTLQGKLDKKIAASTHAKKMSITGTIDSQTDEALLKGKVDTAPFSARMRLKPFELREISYKNGAKKDITFKKNKQGQLEGSLELDYVQDLVRHFLGYQIQGQGTVAIKVNVEKTPYMLDVSLLDANIKIPETHNFIKEGRATIAIDVPQQCVTIKNAQFQLQKGTVNTGCSTFVFSDGGSLLYAHAPLIANNAYVSWNKDFYGTFSGAVTGIYRSGRWTCTGTLTLDKGHLRSNLLSSQVQKDLLRSSSPLAKNVDLDIHFSTRSPLVVKTFFFNTNAQVKASVKGTLAQPVVAGSIELFKGAFFFPINLSM